MGAIIAGAALALAILYGGRAEELVVLVPAAAVLKEADETAVFVANGEKAERRVVTLGLAAYFLLSRGFDPPGAQTSSLAALRH